MQGQGSTGHQKMDEEDNKYYLEAPDTTNTHSGRFGGEQAAGADWQGNTDSAAGFGRRKNSGSDYGGQGQGRGRDGPGQRAIGVNRRSRSRSQSKERNSGRLQDNQDDGDKTVEDDRRFMYVCCKKCKTSNKTGKTCVCVVPRSQRRVQLHVEGGCRTCGCKGCTKEDREYNERNNRNNPQNSTPLHRNHPHGFGQKLFKKDPSSSPDREKDRGHQGQSGYSAEKPSGRGGANVANRRGNNNQRNKSQDSDSAESDSRSNQSNHNERQAFQTHESFGLGALIQNQYHKYPPLYGFGIPLRTQNYIMGETKPLGGNNPSN